MNAHTAARARTAADLADRILADRQAPTPGRARRAARAALDFVGGWVAVALVVVIVAVGLIAQRADAAPAPVAPAPPTPTLRQPGNVNPAAYLDASQVEAPSLGDTVDLADVVAVSLYGEAEDAVNVAAWLTYGVLVDGATIAPHAAGVDADGTDHSPCLAYVGDTTYVACADGWTTES